jgi:hypothetical protein
LPIIINTAYGQFRDDFHCWGAEAFIVKSSDLSELKDALARAIPATSTTNNKTETAKTTLL